MKEQVERWLQEQGYPLEFQVANELEKHSFNVIQSDYYTDPETGESREIDVIGYKQKKIGDVLFRMSFIIECKAGKDKPWVMFSYPNKRMTDEAKIVQTPSTFLGNIFLKQLATIDKYHSLDIFSLGNKPSFGITQSFTTGKDIPYQALRGVAKATDFYCKTQSKARQSPICNVIFPIVVIQAPLFESYFDKELITNEIESGTIAWRNNLISMPHSIIKVQKFAAFKSFLPSYVDEFEMIIEDAERCGILDKVKTHFDDRNFHQSI